MYQFLIAYAVFLTTIGVSMIAAIVMLVINCIRVYKMYKISTNKEKEAK